jgi:hypothetical protein
LQTGLADLGLEMFVPDPKARSLHIDYCLFLLLSRLPTVNTIKVPQGIDFQAVCGHAMKK